MKELSKKTFITIFLILSLFLLLGIITFNVQSYKREYENINRNLNFMKERQKPNSINSVKKDTEEPKFDNMKIIDYEVYTVKLNSTNNIEKIINHGNSVYNPSIKNITDEILKNKSSKIKIGNLYVNDYSYNYKANDSIVIINTKEIKNRLVTLLMYSLLILIVLEIFIYIISEKITNWITKPAKEAFKKQKDFVADVSHELKTPLAVIMASSDELKVSKSNEKYINNIKYESERMNNLIKSMLDLSKLENGSSKEIYKEENISKIVNKICLTFEAVAFENEVEILTDIEDNLTYMCNKDEIEKLISIILDNAIKHSYKKSIININMHKVKNGIEIAITNSGDPIKKGEEDKIFERFYRGDESRNRDNNRYGLGLAIAKNIVVNHGGVITAKSNDGGTTFKIVFKRK